MGTLKLKALEKAHNVAEFDCEVPALNKWLQTVAGQHQKNGTSKTFVLIDDEEPETIIGFFAMALRAPTLVDDLPQSMQKKLPKAVSGYTLARLAVDAKHKKKNHGETLLMYAMQKAKQASNVAAGFGLFVDAKDGAASFYEKYGFVAFPDDKDTLVYPISEMPDFPLEKEEE